jgi:hypothetical protein
LSSYLKVKKVRRIQKCQKNKTINPYKVEMTQLNNLIDVQLEFENYMNQLDLYHNIFNKEKANILLDLAHQMEHYLNELFKAFGNLEQSNPVPQTDPVPQTNLNHLKNQIAGGHPNLKDGVCKGRPPLSWNCLVFYDKTSLT